MVLPASPRSLPRTPALLGVSLPLLWQQPLPPILGIPEDSCPLPPTMRPLSASAGPLYMLFLEMRSICLYFLFFFFLLHFLSSLERLKKKQDNRKVSENAIACGESTGFIVQVSNGFT